MLSGMPTKDSLNTMLQDSAKFSAEAKLAAAQNTCNQLQNMVFALAMQQMLAKGQNAVNGNAAAGNAAAAGEGNAAAAAGNGNAIAVAGDGNAAANAAWNNTKADTTTLKSAAIDQIGKKMATFKHGLGTTTSGDEMSKTGKGDCWAGADYLKKELEKSGYQARIIEYPTSQANNHRSVQLQINGQWVDFPYKQYGIDKNFGSYHKGSFKVLEK